MTNARRFALAAVLCALAVYWYVRRTKQPAAPEAAARVADAGPPSAPTAAPPGPAPAAPPAQAPGAGAALGFRRIDPAARRALLDRIAARAAARTGGTTLPPLPATAPAPLPGAFTTTTVLDAIMPLVPAIQDCYDETRASRTHDRVHVTFDVTLVGDPEVGTLIDAIKLDGDDAFRSDPELGTCLRETMLAVELPPMTGGERALFHTSMDLLDSEPTDAGL